MSAEQSSALEKLQDYELRVAAKNLELQEELFDPVEGKIEKELFNRVVRRATPPRRCLRQSHRWRGLALIPFGRGASYVQQSSDRGRNPLRRSEL